MSLNNNIVLNSDLGYVFPKAENDPMEPQCG